MSRKRRSGKEPGADQRRDHQDQQDQQDDKSEDQISHADLIECVLQELAEAGLQSDARYVDIAIRSRIRKGYGPHYIERELRSKGIQAHLIEASEEWQAADWFQLAHDLKARRFPNVDAKVREEDPKLWQKAVRTMQQRGFSSSHISEILFD